MALHFISLKVFFKLYAPDILSKQMSLLKQLIDWKLFYVNCKRIGLFYMELILTVERTSNFICLDTNDLQNTSENVKRAQYYNLLTWTCERMSRDRQEKVMLYVDEAYLLVDPQVPQGLIYLRNIAKRARKYMAGLCVISHSVVDFLDHTVKLYGQALLDIPAYKIIMGTDGVNLMELSKIYNLSEFEEEKCSAKKRGVLSFL